MSKTGIGLLLIVVVLGLVPFALIARSRAVKSATLPLHPVLDMVKQPKFKSQRENMMFEDHRSMRPELPGVLAQQDLELMPESMNNTDALATLNGQTRPVVIHDAEHYAALLLGRQRPAGMTDAQFDALMPPTEDKTLNSPDQKFYVRSIPPEVEVTAALMKRGQERFNIYCAPCHGQDGYGAGMVALRAKAMQESGASTAANWAAPTSYHSDTIRGRPVGSIYNTITNGVRTMPRYDKQISVMDSWAIVAYVKALQRSQYSTDPADVPEVERGNLK